jgi:hypothetical protein
VLNTSTLTEGLYHKGISMSGANGGDLGTATLADAEARYPGMRVGGAAGRGSGRGGPQ